MLLSEKPETASRMTSHEAIDVKGRHQGQRKGSPASFASLAEALYAVRRLCPILPVLAIQWMHPKHPIHPVQEELMTGAAVYHPGRRKGERSGAMHGLTMSDGWLWRCARQTLTMLRFVVSLTLRLIQLRWSVRREIRVLKDQRFDVIAKTWCFGPDRSADDRDFYYGDLQRRLADRGVRMLLLCGDASGGDWRAFARTQVSTATLCRLPELCLVSPLVPITMAFAQIVASFWLRWMALRSRSPLMKRVAALASRDCLLPSTTGNALFFWIGRAVVRTWAPPAFLSLYEGQAWETCAWWGVKSADGSCRTVGYQHTVLFPHLLSRLKRYRDRSGHSAPDIILCTGDRTRSMLHAAHLPPQSRLVVFGSLRRNSDEELLAAPQPSRRTVLVLPEGLLSEATLLFNFVLRAASLLPDHRFIFRCHPVLPFARVRQDLEVPPKKFPNIEISEAHSIAHDFARSSAVLYRGSSAALHAVLAGLKPIYLHDVRHHDADPLFELTVWREDVPSVSEMVQRLQRYALSSDDTAAEQWRVAIEQVDAYLAPVDEASIDRFLGAVGLAVG